MELKNKNALITGGTKGIGEAIVIALLEQGAKVFLCARDEAAVQQKVEALKQVYGNRVFGSPCDVSNFEDVQHLFQEVEQRLSGIDILVNNAGVGCFSTVEDLAITDWQQTLAINLSGVFYCCHEAIPLMKKRGGGYIINIGSLAGKEAFAGAAAYCATKFGLVGFSEALMQEVRHEHIRVSYVMPGSVNTDFGRHQKTDKATTWKLNPEDVAEVVLNLLKMNPRALPSRVEIRPSEPPKKG
ncbi:MAG: SDR family oxidoreductase [Acidobacteriota bacterium]